MCGIVHGRGWFKWRGGIVDASSALASIQASLVVPGAVPEIKAMAISE